jgi:hypothetical protein
MRFPNSSRCAHVAWGRRPAQHSALVCCAFLSTRSGMKYRIFPSFRDAAREAEPRFEGSPVARLCRACDHFFAARKPAATVSLSHIYAPSLVIPLFRNPLKW